MILFLLTFKSTGTLTFDLGCTYVTTINWSLCSLVTGSLPNSGQEKIVHGRRWIGKRKAAASVGCLWLNRFGYWLYIGLWRLCVGRNSGQIDCRPRRHIVFHHSCDRIFIFWYQNIGLILELFLEFSGNPNLTCTYHWAMSATWCVPSSENVCTCVGFRVSFHTSLLNPLRNMTSPRQF